MVQGERSLYEENDSVFLSLTITKYLLLEICNSLCIIVLKSPSFWNIFHLRKFRTLIKHYDLPIIPFRVIKKVSVSNRGESTVKRKCAALYSWIL